MECNNICSLIRWHFEFFRAWGFCPISLKSHRVARIEERFLLMWTLTISIFFNWLTVEALVHRDLLLFTADGFGFFTDIIKLIVTAITLQISIVEPWLMRKYSKRFWLQYIQLTSRRGLQETPLARQMHEYKRFLFMFYGYILFNLLIELIFAVTSYTTSLQIILFWIMFSPYMYSLRFRTLHFQFHIELIHKEIENLDIELALLVDYTEFGAKREAFEKFDEFIRQGILEKQRVYQLIYEMVESFKLSSGWSLIAAYAKSYIRVLVDCYWVYWMWFHKQNSFEDFLVIPALIEIPMFLLNSKRCMTATKNIAFRVHNIRHSVDNLATSVQIQNFSLQLLHQKIRIDAVGIAVLDGYMLTKAVGSITTYMIFFIQFMPKFQHL